MAKRDKTPKSINRSVRQRVLKRDRYICGYCGLRKKPSSLDIDHIIPRGKGGHHGIKNFVTACIDCNRRKKWRKLPRENGAPALIIHSGRKVAKLTLLAKGRKFPKRMPKISYRATNSLL